MKKNKKYWKSVALWLANMHAVAYEQEGRLERTSDKHRTRMRTVCQMASILLAGCPGVTEELNEETSSRSAVIERLNRVTEVG